MQEGDFGNPASTSHIFGWEANELVEAARVQVAELVNANALDIVWTSGATESDNQALKGVFENAQSGHFITSTYEHKAVLDTAVYLEERGFDVTWVTPDGEGKISPQIIEDHLRPETLLVSIMHVNNEIGVINDVASIGAVCRKNDVLFHVDGAQSVGKIPVDVEGMNIDLLSISGHKIYGPKGVGVLVVRRQIAHRLQALIHGGGHERGLRSGTLATHQIVGMGEAANLCTRLLGQEGPRILGLRNRLWSHLRQISEVYLNGSESDRIPGILNVGFGQVDGETLLMSMDDIAVSSGSACTSATIEPSYVLRALDVPDELASASLRFSLGRFTTEEEVDFTGLKVTEVVQNLRLNSN